MSGEIYDDIKKLIASFGCLGWAKIRVSAFASPGQVYRVHDQQWMDSPLIVMRRETLDALLAEYGGTEQALADGLELYFQRKMAEEPVSTSRISGLFTEGS